MSKLEDLELDISDLKDFFKEVSKFMKNNSFGSSANPEEIENLSKKIDSLTQNFSDLQKQTSAFQEATSSQISALSESCQTLETKLGEVSTSQTETNSRIDALTTTNESLTKTVNNLSQSLESVSENVATLSDNFGTLSGNVDKINGDLKTMDTRLSNLESKTQTLAGDLSVLSEQVKTLTGDVSEIKNTTIVQLSSEISAFGDDLSALTSKVETDLENLTSVGDKVDNLYDVVIPELESKIAQGGGSSGGDGGSSGGSEWVTLYDMDSPDPEINKGATDGVGYNEATDAWKDINIMPYNYLRLKLNFGNKFSHFVIYLDDALKNSSRMEFHRFFSIFEEGTTIFAGALITQKTSDDFLKVDTMSIFRFAYSVSNRSWTREDERNNVKDYHICRLEAKV